MVGDEGGLGGTSAKFTGRLPVVRVLPPSVVFEVLRTQKNTVKGEAAL